MQKAIILSMLERYDESLAATDEIFKELSDNPSFLFFRSIIYIKTEQYEEALKSIESALEIDPDNYNILH